MKLTKYEQETIINYNQEEDMAQIYTCDKNLIRKIDANIEKTHVNYCIRRDELSATYSLPKKFVKVAFSRQLSEEQRKKLALRMKAMKAQKGENNDKGGT